MSRPASAVATSRLLECGLRTVGELASFPYPASRQQALNQAAGAAAPGSDGARSQRHAAARAGLASTPIRYSPARLVRSAWRTRSGLLDVRFPDWCCSCWRLICYGASMPTARLMASAAHAHRALSPPRLAHDEQPDWRPVRPFGGALDGLPTWQIPILTQGLCGSSTPASPSCARRCKTPLCSPSLGLEPPIPEPAPRATPTATAAGHPFPSTPRSPPPTPPQALRGRPRGRPTPSATRVEGRLWR